MCGILGLLGAAADACAPEDFAARLLRMQHRGPDGDGSFAEPGVRLGMRRLAVIDLARGTQPFTSRDGAVVAFQNGEIYNHRALQRELAALGYHFRSHCDTEVLAHGYDAWGILGLLRRLDGMYAVAIYDRTARRLHLARDRFGEKPLFYAHDGRSFAFASDLRALRDLAFVDTRIDLLALDRYLALHFSPGRRTIHRGIRRLLPGERMELDLERCQITTETYYRPRIGGEQAFDRDELRDLLRAAVTSRLESDVPVGIFLSGGLDSSLLTAFAVESHPAIRTFSMGFADPACDESAQARAVADAFGTQHHHFVFGEQDFRELLPPVVAALDEPIGDQATLPLYWLCREARRHVTVVLSGEGADEAFGGYSYYRPPPHAALLGALRAARLLDNAGNTTPSGFPLLTSEAERRALVPDLARADDPWEHGCLALVETATSGQQARSLTDALTWLPDDLLVKFDRVAMAHSLEGRAPYLMPPLFEYGLRLPEAWRLARGSSKLALRAAARGLLPDAVVDGAKRGFVLPMRRWLASWFEGVSLPSYVAERCPDGLDADAATRILRQDLERGVKRERLLFALVMLLEWTAHTRSELRRPAPRRQGAPAA